MATERVILSDMGNGIYKIKPEGRESRPRTAYGLDQAALVLGGLAKSGYDITEAERKLLSLVMRRIETVRGYGVANA